MSLLLDALKKADHERRTQEDAHSLNTHDLKANTGKQRLPSWLWLLIGVLTICVLVLLVLLLSKQLASDEIADSTVAIAAPTRAELTQRANQGERHQTSHNESAKTKDEIQVPANKKFLDTKPQQQRQPETRPDDGILDLYKEETLPEDSGGDETTNAPGQSAPAARQPVSTQSLSRESASNSGLTTLNENSYMAHGDRAEIKDLPLSMQENIPTLIYSEHNYLEGGASYIVINGQRLIEGNRISGDLQLEKILSDGILMRLADRRLRMRALNSWLNY